MAGSGWQEGHTIQAPCRSLFTGRFLVSAPLPLTHATPGPHCRAQVSSHGSGHAAIDRGAWLVRKALRTGAQVELAAQACAVHVQSSNTAAPCHSEKAWPVETAVMVAVSSHSQNPVYTQGDDTTGTGRGKLTRKGKSLRSKYV